jgi:predicted dehydrogenase/threonine dehydrogenase-like Zn-dependent dehydrogenase
MRQLLLEKGKVVLKDVCEPLLDERAVLVQVHYSYISAGTETATIASMGASDSLTADWYTKFRKVCDMLATHGYQGTKALVKEKLAGSVLTLGYSCSGQVVAVGAGVKNIRVGDYVACAGSSAHHADLVCVPEQLVAKIPNAQLLHDASITTVGAIALQGVRRAQLQIGETVCVVGLGLLGQLTVQLAKLAGCRVIGIDLLQERLELATTLGADLVFNASSATLVQDVAYATEHAGVDVTIITAASKSSSIVQQAMQLTRKKGKVVVVGDVGLQLERSPLYEKEIDFLISCSYGPGRYDMWYEQYGNDYPYAYVRWTEQRNMQAIITLLAQGKLNVTSLSETVPLTDALVAYERIATKKALGVIVAYEQQQTVQQHNEVSPISVQRPKIGDRLRIGVIGCGGFARFKIMPIVAQLKNATIVAVVDRDIPTITKAGLTYDAAMLRDDEQLYASDLVDAVIVASPHKFHAQQLERALQQGKAVFVEKPLVTTYEQLERVRELVRRFPDVALTVDFNRPFAPFMQKIKREIVKRTGPLVVHYRMNAGYIPQEHWIQTDVGAGQIIGQACHIFDLFCFLTDAKPVAVSVETIAPRKDLFPTDNFTAQMRFDDGSVCQLLFTAVGSSQLSKERMELHYDGKTIVMDDFLTLTGYGLPSSFNEKVTTQDKGHEALITKFFNAVHAQQPMPIPVDYLVMISELTLLIDALAQQGGGQSAPSYVPQQKVGFAQGVGQ